MCQMATQKKTHKVALRKESVDRNKFQISQRAALTAVALRKESVDRNIGVVEIFGVGQKSLSARRAWIEISK